MKFSMPLKANSSHIDSLVENVKPHEWIFIDEIQRVPLLMDEVHRLIEEKKFKFAISGSSVRKLKREGVNLLAGRALLTYLFPSTLHEYKMLWV